MKRLKIFVSAYACEPDLGSEIGVGWHWVLEMSKYFELWVLTRESNRHSIEPWIAQHPAFAQIHWLYYDLPKWARFWKKGLRGVRLYYNLWQVCTNQIVKRTMQANDIRVFHHLTYGNVLWKVSSYGQKQFFIWGPVGGLETIPNTFSKHYGWRNRLLECVRRWNVSLLPLNRGFIHRCEQVNLMLCKTEITRSFVPVAYRDKTVLQTDVAVEEGVTESLIAEERNDDTLRLITVGRLDAWRGFDLCIEALAKAAKQVPHIHLTFVGSGSDETRLREIAKRLHVAEKVTFTGKVPGSTYKQLLAASDVVVNASLKEGAVTVSFDSMALGKPLICIDTTGYTRYFKEEYAVIVPAMDRSETIEALAEGMVRLRNQDVRRVMGTAAREAGKNFSWKQRGREIQALLSEQIRRYEEQQVL